MTFTVGQVTYRKTLVSCKQLRKNWSNPVKISNTDLLTEVTYGEVGVSPMMEKSSGRMSPVRGRTMKEYDQQIAELKKENFNLKLRIYFMEERMNTKYSEEDILKTNIELKVEMENYKKDIIEKQALLEKASETIDTLTSKYSEELEKEVENIKHDCDDKVQQAEQRVFDAEQQLATLADQLEMLEQECSVELKPSLQRKDKQIEELTANLEERDREICRLEEKIKSLQLEVAELKGQAEKQETEFGEEMENLRTRLGRKDRDLARLSFIVEDKTSVEAVTALERSHLKDEVEDTKKDMEKFRKACDKYENDLKKKSQMIGKLEDILRTKEKEKEALKKAYDERTAVYTRSKEVIQGFSKDAHEKSKKISQLENDLGALQEELSKARDDLQEAKLQKEKDTEKVSDLEQNLERLARTLGKKEGELENFRDLLEKAQHSLSLSEAAVESLQTQLEKERCCCRDKGGKKTFQDGDDSEVSHLRRELDELQSQLEEREKQYQSKCDELDSVAKRLNIHVTSQSGGNQQSDMLAKIMAELQQLKGAVESERHVHIDISSTQLSTLSDVPTHHENTQSHGLDIHFPRGQGQQMKPVAKNGSRIPVRHSSSTGSVPDDLQTQSEELESFRGLVAELRAKNLDLSNTLKATEETVHRQTQKMKQYRNILVERGLMPKSRSNSVPNVSMSSMSNLSPTSEHSSDWSRGSCLSPRRHKASLDIDDARVRCRSVSPTPVGRRQHMIDEIPEDIDKLMKENAKLKQQVDGYRRVLKVFQGRCTSPDGDVDRLDAADGEPAPISSERASCILETWLDMLDKFLLEMSQCDQDGQPQPAKSNLEVSRLRRGLVQARGALQSLSEASLVAQEKLSEGRLSPDSGCSDNPASALNTLKGSLPESPTGNRSLGTSPGSVLTSPGSDAGSQQSASLQRNGTAGSPSSVGQDFVDCNTDFSTSYKPDGKKNRYQSVGSSNTDTADFSLRSRDAGQYPKSSNTDSTMQSVEGLRGCDVASTRDLSVFSIDEIDGSIGSSAPGAQTLRLVRNRNAYIPNRPNLNGAHNDSSLSAGKRLKSVGFDKTFSQTFLSADHEISVGDITANGDYSLLQIREGSPLDLTLNGNSEDQNSAEEMRERIKSLEDIIKSYEEQIRQQSRPDMDSLQQQLLELRNLRIQLEKSMARNEALEKQLMELYRMSESAIQDLNAQLAEKENDIQEKMHIIIEKETQLTETTITLTQLKDNSSKDAAELSAARNKVKSLETELTKTKGSCDQLRSMCQQLKTAVEQYKKRSEQLEGDNKKHMEAVYKYQNKVKDLEDELQQKTSTDSEVVDGLRANIEQLEHECHQHEENENKYKQLLSEVRQQVSELTSDREMLKQELDQRNGELKSLSVELERSRDTIEEQNQHLCDNANFIDQLKRDMEEKTSVVREQDGVCQDLMGKLENLTSVNGKLSTQLEQQRLTCADYKRQIEKQSQLVKDLKEKTDSLRDELTQTLHDRENQDKLIVEKQKELQETSQQREKYLHNLKVTYKEFQRVKKELKEAQKKIEDTSALNSTLQTELSVRERLQDKGEMLTDDDKYNMIQELLNELKLARIQMSKILEQNDSIRQRMTELIEQMKQQQSGHGKGQSGDNINVDISVNKSLNEDVTNVSLDGNQTWPLYGDLVGGIPRTDNLSCSLPIRESTPGGPASRTRQSDLPLGTRQSDFHSQSTRPSDFPPRNARQSEFSSQSTRRSDFPSQNARQSDFTSQSTKQSDFPSQSTSQSDSLSQRGQSDFPSQQSRRSDLSQHSKFSHHSRGSYLHKTSKLSDVPDITQRNAPHRMSSLDDAKNRSQNHGNALSSSFGEGLSPVARSSTVEAQTQNGNHFSIPGPIYKQGISDHCLLYHVNDSPKYLAGLTQVRIDSDIRSLFAIGMIDHYEKLRKETNECIVILKGVNTRIKERLKVFASMSATESVEYHTLKELSYAAENLRICVESQVSLIGCFWTSELPAPNERGEFVNQKLLDQNTALREEVCLLVCKLKEVSGKKNTLPEEEICKSLESTLDVVTRAKQNLQHRTLSPHCSPSHSPRK